MIDNKSPGPDSKMNERPRKLRTAVIGCVIVFAVGTAYWAWSLVGTDRQETSSRSANALHFSLSDDQCRANAQKQFQDLCDKLNGSDGIQKAVDSTPPEIVSAAGGKSAMLKAGTDGLSSLKTKGFQPMGETVGKVGPVFVGRGRMFVTLPVHTVMAVPGRILKSYMTSEDVTLGVSYDEGQTWFFANVTDPRVMRQIFPDIPKAMPIPTRPTPLRHLGTTVPVASTRTSI